MADLPVQNLKLLCPALASGLGIAGRDDVFRLSNYGPAGRGHDDVEIACGQRIFQVAAIIGTVSGDQRKNGG